ncbi:MAG: hypothetical protein HUJ69_03890 [Lachnospiraceae bacterium]|nr:hypothetical protein [Lachnospiraceae bacterium]
MRPDETLNENAILTDDKVNAVEMTCSESNAKENNAPTEPKKHHRRRRRKGKAKNRINASNKNSDQEADDDVNASIDNAVGDDVNASIDNAIAGASSLRQPSVQQRQKALKKQISKRVREIDLTKFLTEHVDEIVPAAIKEMEKYLTTGHLYRLKYTEFPDYTAVDPIPLTEKDLTPFMEWALTEEGLISEDLVLMAFAGKKQSKKKGSVANFLFHYLIHTDPIFAQDPHLVPRTLLKVLEQHPYCQVLTEDVRRSFTEVKLAQCLDQNHHYDYFSRNLIQAARHVARDKKQRASLKKRMLSEIPDNYIDFYPEARAMERHFVLHVGPTNSGKTYDAIEALAQTSYGIYLAPLRLLAYEQFENLNRRGIPCSLITGEERVLIDNAEHQSSTIELANFHRFYDVAVIDEAQMITDEERGGHWTAAILGLQAYEIHVCMAPHAEEIVTRLIEDCGDTYETVRHHRQTPLRMETKHFNFPEGVRKGDALIVFSRRNVHAVASELTNAGYRCSIIYGALPYDVRHAEAERFSNGDTDIVVATDAIGMGLNLPVRRIIFLETEKFNGHGTRPLQPSEIQQIAGRAGRFGMFDEGLVNTFPEDAYFIHHGLTAEIEPVQDAMLSFPESLLTIDAKVSKILSEWNDMTAKAGFLKSTVKTMISLATHLEGYTSDKELIYSLITIPFDERDDELFDLWSELSFNLIKHRDLQLEKRLDDALYGLDNMTVGELESAYRITDLLFGFSTRAKLDMDLSFIESKRRISECIMKLLSEAKLQHRTCRSCGKPIPWSSPFSVCTPCYRRRNQIRIK